MIDLHTHILPSIDDGPETLDESLALCRLAAEDGISMLVATPHMFCDVGNPTREQVSESCSMLIDALTASGIDIELRFAAEVALIENLAARIERGEVPMLDEGQRYVLLEVPRVGDCSKEISEMVFQLQLKEITPVICHPEAIESFYHDSGLAEQLVRQGAFLQVTASSFMKNGQRYKMVLDLLEKGLVHVVASDAHDVRYRPPLLSGARAVCERLAGVENAEKLFCSNPKSILNGKDPESLQPIAKPRNEPQGIMGAFRRMLGVRELAS